MDFSVIGVAFKPDLMLVKRSIDTDRCLQNLIVWPLSMHGMKSGIFGRIFRQNGALAQTSQATFDRPKESVDVIVSWPANSPGLSSIEVVRVIPNELVRRT
jgi:hypothetical protein